MSEIFSTRNRWFTGSVLALLVVFVIAALVGLVWLPRAHASGESLWDAICSAAGAPGRFENASLPEEKAVYPTSVVVSADMMGATTPQQVGHGATLALACTMCHGAQGTSPAGTPHLAGQQASSLYKQLRDFKSGHRQSAIMQPLVANLSEQDMRDLAVYYASQTRDRPTPDRVGPATPRLVRDGDPMRNVGACASCHSPNVRRPATPTLDGMNADYLRAQLLAFHSGARANDINRQMRNAAHLLTPQEIDELVRYYASR
ncbi:c-type cytochrome [Massilia terrae]|uniref:C-type cytochrome n=1 Tax=Massilia terrae TaxID=1811224 RepID=A0ABT2D2X8_9BURK|nr:c-type cytochrome [Massilia terrae]MCS0660385.1 c-type cytochrome [Massilia terrae]